MKAQQKFHRSVIQAAPYESSLMVTSPKMSEYGEIHEIKQIEHENTKMYIKINKKGMGLFSPDALKNLNRGPKTPINGSLGLIESDYSRNNEGENRY
jgi:hypothetical protein